MTMTKRDYAYELLRTLKVLRPKVNVLGDARVQASYSHLIAMLRGVQTSEHGQDDVPALEQSPGTAEVFGYVPPHTLEEPVETEPGNTELYNDGLSIRTTGKLEADKASVLHLLQLHMQAIVEQITKRAAWDKPDTYSSDLFCTKVFVARTPRRETHCELLTHLAFEREPGDPVVWSTPPTVTFNYSVEGLADDLRKYFIIAEDQFSRVFTAYQLLSELLDMTPKPIKGPVSKEDLHSSVSSKPLDHDTKTGS
jgi:hypothetical protein